MTSQAQDEKEWWQMILFGWPAIIASLVLSVAGLVSRKPALLLAGALAGLLPLLYLGLTPRFWLAGLVSGLAYFGSVVALRSRYFLLAWALFLPFASLAAFTGYLVRHQ